MTVSMWARSTNTLFDWWLVLICCERKILLASTYKVAGVTLQGSITSRVLLQHRILALHLHGSCSICAQVFKFSKWSQKGGFSVKSTYDSSDDNGDSFSRIWKAKLPYKIKIFLWLIEQGAILTKDNTVRRRWPGNPSCCFCDNMESINHLFFTCPTAKVVWSIVAKSIGAINIPNSVAQFWNWCRNWISTSIQIHAYVLAAICWSTWKARNNACFNNKLIHHPAEIVFHACTFLTFWASLHKEEVQSQIMKGVGILMSLACQMLATPGRSTPRLILPPSVDQRPSEDEAPGDEDDRKDANKLEENV